MCELAVTTARCGQERYGDAKDCAREPGLLAYGQAARGILTLIFPGIRALSGNPESPGKESEIEGYQTYQQQSHAHFESPPNYGENSRALVVRLRAVTAVSVSI